MTIQQSNYSVRTMTRQELTIAMDWAAVDLVHRHNMIPAFETVRMYRGVGHPTLTGVVHVISLANSNN